MKDLAASKILEGAGLRKTQGRMALIKLLLDAENPLTQQELMNKLKVKLNYVSIYRSLETFEKAGIIHKVESGDRVWRFALGSNKKQDHNHPHFSCKKCGVVECLEDIKIPQITPPKEGYIIEKQELNLKGICSHCSKRKAF